MLGSTLPALDLRSLTTGAGAAMPTIAFLVWGVMLVPGLLLAGCERPAAEPGGVALEYSRALYAQDAAHIYRLASAVDRRAREESALQSGAPTGFALEVTRHLASFITATPRESTIAGDRATLKLELRLPDANAAAVSAVVQGWDERSLDALSAADRTALLRRLTELHEAGTLPVVTGEHTFELVREDGTWRMSLGWARGIRVRFHAEVPETLPLQVEVRPAEIRITPGERVRVSLTAKNLSAADVTVRVGHRIEPAAHRDALALLQCPLFVPLTLAPGRPDEFVSEYLLLPDVPKDTGPYEVTYQFRRESSRPISGAAGKGP